MIPAVSEVDEDSLIQEFFLTLDRLGLDTHSNKNLLWQLYLEGVLNGMRQARKAMCDEVNV